MSAVPAENLNAQPIGVFDSGIGGLSIANAIRQTLPNESLIYLADQGYAPYGTRPAQQIEARCLAVAEALLEQGCKAIVIACNTATVNAVTHIRQRLPIPIIGVEPGIKPASARSRSGVIAVLATELTLSSPSYQKLYSDHCSHTRILNQACPLFVDLVEQLKLESASCQSIVNDYIEPLLKQGADQLVLGCTHFAFLAPLIEQQAQGRAKLVDTALAVATQLKSQLRGHGLLNTAEHPPSARFITSGCPAALTQHIEKLWWSQSETTTIDGWQPG